MLNFCVSMPSEFGPCSVVVITPDFDVHLQNFPATAVRIRAGPIHFGLFFVFLTSVLYEDCWLLTLR